MTTAIAKESSSLAWLKAAIGEQRDIVASLLRRLTLCGPQGSIKPSVFPKFLRTLEQISVEKDIETEIISRIQMIESRHRFQRRCKRLRVALPKPKPGKYGNYEVEYEPERKDSDNGWWLIVGLIYLMSRRGPRPQE